MPMGRVTVTLPAEILSDIDNAEKNRSAFILDAVRRELSRRRRMNLGKSLQNPHVESSGNAEAGFDAWAGSLPEEDLSIACRSGDPCAGAMDRGEGVDGRQEMRKVPRGTVVTLSLDPHGRQRAARGPPLRHRERSGRGGGSGTPPRCRGPIDAHPGRVVSRLEPGDSGIRSVSFALVDQVRSVDNGASGDRAIGRRPKWRRSTRDFCLFLGLEAGTVFSLTRAAPSVRFRNMRTAPVRFVRARRSWRRPSPFPVFRRPPSRRPPPGTPPHRHRPVRVPDEGGDRGDGFHPAAPAGLPPDGAGRGRRGASQAGGKAPGGGEGGERSRCCSGDGLQTR